MRGRDYILNELRFDALAAVVGGWSEIRKLAASRSLERSIRAILEFQQKQ
jgi:hypothetical protein